MSGEGVRVVMVTSRIWSVEPYFNDGERFHQGPSPHYLSRYFQAFGPVTLVLV